MSFPEFNTEADPTQGVHLTLHLINGRRLVFEQTDPHKTEALIDHLRPERIFSQKNLLAEESSYRQPCFRKRNSLS